VVLGMVDGLRGLTAMVPDSDVEFEGGAVAEAPDWFALASDYTPTELGLKAFMAPLASQVFPGLANDLVVPADSVWRGPGTRPFPLADDAVLLFGEADGVGHSDYFRNDRAVERVLAWLT